MFKLFKNSKAAKKHLSHIQLNLQAVDKQLKPCYLWDAFTADVNEIQHYLNELNLCGKTNLNLSVFSVNETHFVTQTDFLKNYLEILRIENVNIVDVSESEDKPSVLHDDEKKNALKPIISYVGMLLKKITDNYDINDRALNVDYSVCNITTLYGALLGYPVLYWYKSQNPDANFTCLSMVPLIVYRVTNSKGNSMSSTVNLNNRLYDHEIFAFSIPQSLSQDTEYAVNSWFTELVAKCKNSVFNDLTLQRGTVTLPYISM